MRAMAGRRGLFAELRSLPAPLDGNQVVNAVDPGQPGKGDPSIADCDGKPVGSYCGIALQCDHGGGRNFGIAAFDGLLASIGFESHDLSSVRPLLTCAQRVIKGATTE